MAIPKDITFVTFDVYGTLIDWESGAFDAFSAEAARDGIDHPGAGAGGKVVWIERRRHAGQQRVAPFAVGMRCRCRDPWDGAATNRQGEEEEAGAGELHRHLLVEDSALG